MRNKLKKHIRTFRNYTHWDGTVKDIIPGDNLIARIYIKKLGGKWSALDSSAQFYYSAIKYDPLNPDWTNMVCKARIRLLDYAVEHWGDKPWEAL